MIIIISGYNQRAVIAFLRTLKMNNIEEYAILARDKEDPILQTSYADKVYLIRKHKELNKEELYPIFDELVSKSSGPTVVVPSTEALNRFLVHNKKEIESHGVIVPLVDESLYSEISDKRSFFELCNCPINREGYSRMNNVSKCPFVHFLDFQGLRRSDMDIWTNGHVQKKTILSKIISHNG